MVASSELSAGAARRRMIMVLASSMPSRAMLVSAVSATQSSDQPGASPGNMCCRYIYMARPEKPPSITVSP